MSNPLTEARKRQLIRLNDAKPPTPRAAMALAKLQGYQDPPMHLRRSAPTPATSPISKAWCEKHGFIPVPATPDTVGAYVATAGEGYAMPTLRRRVAAIARACGVAGQPLDTKHTRIP